MNIEENPNVVDHLRHPHAMTIRALLCREERKQMGKMIIDDEENILQALKANVKLNSIFTTDRENLSPIFYEMISDKVPVLDIAKRTSKKIFGNEKLSRVFAIADTPEPVAIDILNSVQRDIIALNELSISGNIGAIIRTSVALSVGAIVLLDAEPVDIYDRRVIRASRGHVFSVPMVTCDVQSFLRFCQTHAIKMLATTPSADYSIDDIATINEKLAIVLGSEKEGCNAELLGAADIKASIPMNADVESLNVSVAASIILYLRSLHYRGFSIEKP